jgi:hypothetical protein
MRYTTLPGTDLRVSVIAMGSWALAGDMAWGDQSERDSIDAARAAVDVGITFFDTAPGYGDGISEQRLGKGLEGLRDRVVVATKVGPDAMRAGGVAASVERSLGHLRTDYIDLIQIHWPSREVPLEETMGALESLKRQRTSSPTPCSRAPSNMRSCRPARARGSASSAIARCSGGCSPARMTARIRCRTAVRARGTSRPRAS